MGTLLQEAGLKPGELPERWNVSHPEEIIRIQKAYYDAGSNVVLANTFGAADFTTAEYFLFMAVKKLQLNPEQSTVRFMTPLSEEEEMSLYRYFKAVETL